MYLLQYFALTIPGNDGKPQTIEAPKAVPTGGLEPGGTGQTVIQNSISLLLITVLFLSLIFLIWGGIKWITASGDKTKLDGARKTIIFAIVGLLLSLLSFVIVNLVGSIIGVDNLLSLPGS